MTWPASDCHSRLVMSVGRCHSRSSKWSSAIIEEQYEYAEDLVRSRLIVAVVVVAVVGTT